MIFIALILICVILLLAYTLFTRREFTGLECISFTLVILLIAYLLYFTNKFFDMELTSSCIFMTTILIFLKICKFKVKASFDTLVSSLSMAIMSSFVLAALS